MNFIAKPKLIFDVYKICQHLTVKNTISIFFLHFRNNIRVSQVEMKIKTPQLTFALIKTLSLSCNSITLLNGRRKYGSV